MYNVRVLLDSVSRAGKRIVTFELTYPRLAHADFLTHRLFSKNAASSRAIPVKKMMDRIKDDPVIPVQWGKNQSGMQAAEELSDEPTTCSLGIAQWPSPREQARQLWLKARDEAVFYAQRLMDLGLHKQLANRITEPWMFITVICTSTEWDNFLNLRATPLAQPELAWVAYEVKKKLAESQPQVLEPGGEWHLPLVTGNDFDDLADEWHDGKVGDGRDLWETLKLISVGRCARVSYLTHEGKRDPNEDIALAHKLMENGHWSPFEHVAQAEHDPDIRIGNFMGWRQFRADVDPTYVKIRCPDCGHRW